MDRILGHSHHHSRDGAEHEAEDSTQHHKGGIREDLKKDDAGLKKYLKEDEELEEEGQTYGGLM